MVNMALYIMVLAGFVGFMAVLFALRFVPPVKVKVEGIIKKALEGTFWNNTIRSISLSYLETGKTLWVQARLYQAAGDKFPLLKCYPILIFMIGYPAICAWAVMKYRDRLEERSMRDRIF